MKHHYNKELKQDNHRPLLATHSKLPERNAIEALGDRIRKSIDRHKTIFLVSTVLTASAVIGCVIVGLLVPVLAPAACAGIIAAAASYIAISTKTSERTAELKSASDKLRLSCLTATPSQINTTIAIVKKGIADSIKDERLINKDKLAFLYSDTLDTIKHANNHKIPITAKLKDDLSTKIADLLNANKKEKTFFQKVKSFFKRDEHIPMKTGGYKVAGAFDDALDTLDTCTQHEDAIYSEFNRRSTFVDRLGNSELSRN
jgi:hypothetical protein